jgi:hypothetical protein
MKTEIPTFGSPFVAKYMIEMAMRIKQQQWLKGCLLDKVL